METFGHRLTLRSLAIFRKTCRFSSISSRVPAAEAVSTLGAACSSCASGFLNIFNHPTFRTARELSEFSPFGQSTQMLGASLGSGGQNGGLNPQHQISGPRSVRLALKLLLFWAADKHGSTHGLRTLKIMKAKTRLLTRAAQSPGVRPIVCSSSAHASRYPRLACK